MNDLAEGAVGWRAIRAGDCIWTRSRLSHDRTRQINKEIVHSHTADYIKTDGLNLESPNRCPPLTLTTHTPHQQLFISTMSGRGKGGKGLGKGGAKRHRKILRDNIQGECQSCQLLYS